jgi:hypothetical protein
MGAELRACSSRGFDAPARHEGRGASARLYRDTDVLPALRLRSALWNGRGPARSGVLGLPHQLQPIPVCNSPSGVDDSGVSHVDLEIWAVDPHVFSGFIQSLWLQAMYICAP